MEELKKIVSDTESLIFFFVIVGMTILFALLLGNFLQRQIEEKTKEHQVDITSFIFLKHMIVAIVYFLGFGWALLTLPITRTFAHSLIAGAGATTLILGFASQQIFSNLFSGIFLVLNRPFKIDDTIEFQGSKGKVIEISLNSTIIQDENEDKIIIPSSKILGDKIKIYKRQKL
ncbi:mechanosensitive ion channel family protein [Xanthocytophaga agilis]|uniref:Mechanosensitive ion channel n=1 Tax=Xanthocytophaga agilis TaxID=3048010 RepID=A0AAE3R6Z7_9BACT|nr:mechanosensitive ion channel domain-containing protein [Xanthocytophaga agilis]MDJ1501847.1 mechanosensitive ion channel [Xanthocytophaga agilis]